MRPVRFTHKEMLAMGSKKTKKTGDVEHGRHIRVVPLDAMPKGDTAHGNRDHDEDAVHYRRAKKPEPKGTHQTQRDAGQ